MFPPETLNRGQGPYCKAAWRPQCDFPKPLFDSGLHSPVAPGLSLRQVKIPMQNAKGGTLCHKSLHHRTAFWDCGSATAGSGAYRRTIGSLSNSPSNNLWLVENNLWQRGEISVLLECPRPPWTFNSFKSN